jgi:hypothetical protein
MNIDGLWTLEFFAMGNWQEAGLIVIENGRILGGNNNHYMMGKYSLSGEVCIITMECKFMGTPVSMFRVKDNKAKVEIKGIPKDNIMEGTLHRLDIQGLDMPAKLIKRAEIS